MKLTAAEVLQEVLKVEAMTDERVAKAPTYGVYLHAKDQMIFMKEILQSGRLPNSEEKGRIDIGIMAVKELDADEPEYAKALIFLDCRFEEL